VTGTLAFHDVANIFPLMLETELDALAVDIATHGLREPIWLDADGAIVDGRNRYLACERAGVEPRFQRWDGEGSLISFVVSLNLHRRHLDTSQRAMVAARIATLSHGGDRKSDQAANLPLDSRTQAEAADLVNVSERSVRTAREVIDTGTPELVRAVETGSITVAAASEATVFEPEVQREVVQRVEAGEKPADVIKELKPHVAHNSGNNEWYTPAFYIAAAVQAMGAIDVDPASSAAANKTVRAKTFYDVENSGLTKTWTGNVWMNPPYATPLIGQFADAVSDKYDAKEIKRACVLVNNATETGWFQRMLTSASAVCFIKGRVRFMDPDGNPSGAPLQGQAVLYLGDDPYRFARSFGELGQVLVKPS
jgi:hypothetical protein